MHRLVLDVRHGATAGALLGAFIEVGASLERIEAAVATLGPGEVRLQVMASPQGSSVRIRAPQGAPTHATWQELRPRVALLALDEQVTSLALHLLDALFAARGQVHGVAPDAVDVDPFSGPDDLAQAVALAAATADLDPTGVTTTAVGHGTRVRTTIEGELRLPGPVVSRLVAPLPTRELDHAFEVVDPVGAAYLTTATAHDHDVASHGSGADARGRGQLPDGSSVEVLLTTSSDRQPA